MFVSLNHTDKDLHQLDKVHWTQTITFPLFLWSCFCILIYQNLNFQPTPWFQQHRRVLTDNFVLLRCVTPGGNFTGNTLLLWKKSFVRKAALCKSLVFFPVWLEFMWTGDHNLLPWLHYFWSCYEIILVVFFFFSTRCIFTFVQSDGLEDVCDLYQRLLFCAKLCRFSWTSPLVVLFKSKVLPYPLRNLYFPQGSSTFY